MKIFVDFSTNFVSIELYIDCVVTDNVSPHGLTKGHVLGNLVPALATTSAERFSHRFEPVSLYHT